MPDHLRARDLSPSWSRRLPRLGAAAAAALVLVAGCGGTPSISGRPTEADEPVISVQRFSSGDDQAARLATMPLGAIYGDGRVFRAAPQLAVEPGPALPALEVTTIDSAGIDTVLTKAAEGGLIGADRELRMPTEADPTLTAFDIFLDGKRRRTIVESLAEIPPDDPRLPPKGLEERAAMNAIVAMLTDPRGQLAANVVSDDGLYAPTRVLVVTSPSDGGSTSVEWPLADLAGLGGPLAEVPTSRCANIEGDDWATLEPIVAAADAATTWTSGGTSYAIRFRPLLPGEIGCPKA